MKSNNNDVIDHKLTVIFFSTKGLRRYSTIKRVLTLLTTVLITVILLDGAVYSYNPFKTEEFRSIVNQKYDNTSEPEDFKPKIIFTIGELFTFEKGGDGFYKDYKFKVAALPATYLDIGFILVDGLTLGIGGTIHYDIMENIFEKSRTFGWAAGGSVFYYIGLKNTVVPYVGFKYFFGQDSSDINDKIANTRMIINSYTHSMHGTGGILFRCTKNFGIYFDYSYIYKKIETDIYGPVTKYTGSYHKACMGFKVFL